MLQPDKNRLDYGALLAPPEGFQLDKAIATSYSLDLDTLISIPIALCFSTTLELEVAENIVQILEAIRRTSESVKVYCQKGQIKVPDNQHRLYSFIEPCVVQVAPTKSESFHPKIWVLRYKRNEEVKYRFIVLSRNMTFDRSWDVVFQVEGDCQQKRKNGFGENKPLLDFIKYLTRSGQENWAAEFISGLAKTKFMLTSPLFEGFEFSPMGIPGYKRPTIFDQKYSEMFVMSPFINKGGLDELFASVSSKPNIFSREFELRRLSDAVLNRFSAFHLTSSFVQGEFYTEGDTEENNDQQLQDLHAKIYCGKFGWDAHLYVGSANCTTRGMHHNIEFMVKLKGKDSKMGPKTIFRELYPDDGSYFTRFLERSPLSEEEIRQCEREQFLQNLKIDLVNSRLIAQAARQDDGSYHLTFTLDLTGIKTNTQISIHARLLNARGQEIELLAGLVNDWEFKFIPELDLSRFLIISLHDQLTGGETEFALKIDIEGFPPNRNNLIFTHIISNTHIFFKYLRFLLSENFWDEQNHVTAENNGGAAAAAGQFLFQEEPIYENMLKAISREPEKLMEIKAVMEKISAEDHDELPIIPEDFKALWAIFEETLTKAHED